MTAYLNFGVYVKTFLTEVPTIRIVLETNFDLNSLYLLAFIYAIQNLFL